MLPHATRVDGGAATPGPSPARTGTAMHAYGPRPARRRLHLRVHASVSLRSCWYVGAGDVFPLAFCAVEEGELEGLEARPQSPRVAR